MAAMKLLLDIFLLPGSFINMCVWGAITLGIALYLFG